MWNRSGTLFEFESSLFWRFPDRTDIPFRFMLPVVKICDVIDFRNQATPEELTDEISPRIPFDDNEVLRFVFGMSSGANRHRYYYIPDRQTRGRMTACLIGCLVFFLMI